MKGATQVYLEMNEGGGQVNLYMKPTTQVYIGGGKDRSIYLDMEGRKAGLFTWIWRRKRQVYIGM